MARAAKNTRTAQPIQGVVSPALRNFRAQLQRFGVTETTLAQGGQTYPAAYLTYGQLSAWSGPVPAIHVRESERLLAYCVD